MDGYEYCAVNERRTDHDWAYACFLFCGLAALLGSLMEVIPKDEGTTALLGFFVAIPLALASIAALIGGVAFWITRLPKDWGLAGLSGTSILFAATLLTGRGSILIAVIYGSAVFAACGVWFLVVRSRYGAAPATAGNTVHPADAADGKIRRS